MNAQQRAALAELYRAYRRAGLEDVDAAIAVADDVHAMLKEAPLSYRAGVTVDSVRAALDAVRREVLS